MCQGRVLFSLLQYTPEPSLVAICSSVWVCNVLAKFLLQFDAALDESPLFVLAGSIVPLAPEVQYSNQ